MIYFATIIIPLILYALPCFSKVLLITHSYNRPDFIEIQHKTFNKFLKDDYEFIVFNDAPQEWMKQDIENTCKKLGIVCIRTPQEIHSTKLYLPKRPEESGNHPCKRCAHVVQYSLDTLGFAHNDLVAIIDSDMFLIKPFSIREYMRDAQLAGVPQGRTNGRFIVEYLWNGIVFFNMPTLPDKERINFNCGYVEGAPTDVGGNLYYYLKEHTALKLKHINGLYLSHAFCGSCTNNSPVCTHNTEILKQGSLSPDTIWFAQQGPDSIEFFADGSFLHYRSGTNWNNKSSQYHQEKTILLQTFISKITQ
jgi:hypothetical protein